MQARRGPKAEGERAAGSTAALAGLLALAALKSCVRLPMTVQ
jgi:hypothetical protein